VAALIRLAGGILAADQSGGRRMIEKQQTSVETKNETEEPTAPLRHVPVPKDPVEEPSDPEVIERLRSCH
jgi:hypothetical protein